MESTGCVVVVAAVVADAVAVKVVAAECERAGQSAPAAGQAWAAGSGWRRCSKMAKTTGPVVVDWKQVWLPCMVDYNHGLLADNPGQQGND